MKLDERGCLVMQRMTSNPNDWRHELAKSVCELVRDKKILQHFRSMCVAFKTEQQKEENVRARWLKKRKEFCMHGVKSLADLKARYAKSNLLQNNRKMIERTRPKKDTKRSWIYEWVHELLDPEELKDLGEKSHGPIHVEFGVWVPPELSWSHVPPLTIPDVFARFLDDEHLHAPWFGTFVEPGPASLAEKYSSIAAVHDACFPDRDPIDQLLHIECGVLTEEVRKRNRDTKRRIVGELSEPIGFNLRQWLRDIEVDLHQRGIQESPIEEGTEMGSYSSLNNDLHFLRHIVAAVHEDTRLPAKRERYAMMARQWGLTLARDGRWKGQKLSEYLQHKFPEWSNEKVNQKLKEAHIPGLGEPMAFPVDPIEITVHAGTPLEKQYATFAAIHDQMHLCDFPIAPWRGVEIGNPFSAAATNEDIDNFVGEAMFRQLREQVASLTAADLPGLDLLLSQLSRDQNEYLDGNNSKARKPKKPQGRPKTSNPIVDARWAAAWKTGGHENKESCAKALGTTEKELQKALDRVRKQSRKKPLE